MNTEKDPSAHPYGFIIAPGERTKHNQSQPGIYAGGFLGEAHDEVMEEIASEMEALINPVQDTDTGSETDC